MKFHKVPGTLVYGMYSGKVLEKITHNEDPWMEARKGYGDSISSHEVPGTFSPFICVEAM